MTETHLRKQLTDALIRIGIDQTLIRFDYMIGKHIVADCVVLSCDSRTPAICFEIKANVTSAPLERHYQVLSRTYRELIGIDVCYLVCLAEIDGHELPVVRIRQDVVRLDSDANTLKLHLGKERADIAIAQANRSNDVSIHNFKVATCLVSSIFLALFVVLDALRIFPLTNNHLIFVLVVMGLPLAPYVIDVLIVHPKFFDQLIKLVEKLLRKG